MSPRRARESQRRIAEIAPFPLVTTLVRGILGFERDRSRGDARRVAST